MNIPAFPDWLKMVLGVVSVAAGVVAVEYTGTVVGSVATLVVAILAGLGITSGGISAQRSDQARAVHTELLEKGTVSK